MVVGKFLVLDKSFKDAGLRLVNFDTSLKVLVQL